MITYSGYTLVCITYLGVAASAMIGCRSSDDGIFKDQLTQDNQSLNGTQSPVASTSPSPGNGGPTVNSGAGGGFGDGSDSGDVGEDAEVSYPILSFTGRGNLDHRNGSASVVQKISASMSKETLTVTVQEFLADGGDNKSDVNKEINKQTGDTVYSRVSSADGSSLTSTGGSFLIFSRSFEDRRNGKSRVFSVTGGDSLPVLVIPAPETRYEGLIAAPIQHRSLLSSNGQSFTVMSTITGRKVGPAAFQVTIDYLIPEDRNGEFYGILPLSKSTVYGIDLSAKRISSIDSRGQYNDEDSNKARAINIAFQLCQSVKDGKVETISGCP